ncbi:MAG: STAS domain-containing protein [Legionella sp.]|nr:STAS domain-containing protein [Legionella sp.]
MSTKAFSPAKEMSFTTVENDRQRLLAYCQQLKEPVLILDLSAVTQCDSAGLAFLIEAKRLAREHKKICQINGMTKTIHALAEFCGVEGILAVE